jgi:hypothetical protein
MPVPPSVAFGSAQTAWLRVPVGFCIEAHASARLAVACFTAAVERPPVAVGIEFLAL